LRSIERRLRIDISEVYGLKQIAHGFNIIREFENRVIKCVKIYVVIITVIAVIDTIGIIRGVCELTRQVRVRIRVSIKRRRRRLNYRIYVSAISSVTRNVWRSVVRVAQKMEVRPVSDPILGTSRWARRIIIADADMLLRGVNSIIAVEIARRRIISYSGRIVRAPLRNVVRIRRRE